jgi:hypothetical protein
MVLVRVLLDILPKIILTSFLGFFFSKKVALKSSSLVNYIIILVGIFTNRRILSEPFVEYGIYMDCLRSVLF